MVSVSNNSPFQDYPQPTDHTRRTTPGSWLRILLGSNHLPCSFVSWQKRTVFTLNIRTKLLIFRAMFTCVNIHVTATPSVKYRGFQLTLKMTSTKVVEQSVTNNSPFQNNPHGLSHNCKTNHKQTNKQTNKQAASKMVSLSWWNSFCIYRMFFFYIINWTGRQNWQKNEGAFWREGPESRLECLKLLKL